METANHTTVTEFIILGLTDNPTLCAIFSEIFLGVYTVTVVGNISIIILIRSSPQLPMPMYLFLSHLAFVDIGYSTSVTPIMLMSFWRERTAIPVTGCIAQLGSDVTSGTTECFLLATIAYNHYGSICSRLLYSTHMSPVVCFFLLEASYLGGCINASSFTGCLMNLSFWGPNKTNHFFCDLFPLLKLSCGHVSIAEISPCHLFCISPHKHTINHNRVLQLHPPLNPEDALYWGEEEGLLYLHFPPHCSHFVSRDSFVCLRNAQIELFSWSGQSGICNLHSGGSHAEPPHLQSEEQGGERGYEKLMARAYWFSWIKSDINL